LVGSAMWSIFSTRHYAKRGICRRRVSAGFVLTRASHSPSAIAELLVNFGGPIHISGMAEAIAIKFCTKGDYIKSCQRDDKSPIKGAWFCSRDPFCMYNCGVRKNSPRHSVNCDKQCSWRQATAYRTYGARGHTKA